MIRSYVLPCGSEDCHVDIRWVVVDELIKGPKKYNLQRRNILKKLKILIHPEQMSMLEVIQALAKPRLVNNTNNINKWRYYVSGIHYNFLYPIDNPGENNFPSPEISNVQIKLVKILNINISSDGDSAV